MTQNQQKTNQEERQYKVFVGTSYLTDSVADFESPEELLKQSLLYGYDINNLHGIKFLSTPRKNTVRLITRENSPDIRIREVIDNDLAIVGSTESSEERVHSIMGSGLIVARYSIFYGGPSGYTSSSPESSGYSLDLPKVVGCAVQLMTDDNFLEALVSREETRIRNAIEQLNKGKESAPILITPYLAEALKVRR
ncbi:MAG: hypothetical protein WC979_10220 [Candidatus Pacearchaeota archaeon]|jgi:hypothetical protein